MKFTASNLFSRFILQKIVSFIVFILVFSGTTLLSQENNYPPDVPGSQEQTYKTIDGVDLKAWIFTPPKHKASDQQPAIVFFFGGGWKQGTPTQFIKHAEYLAARGMVAVIADYRVSSRHGVKVNACVSDAKSAVRWIRQNAERLGVDPNRIAASGGSAGGHLAAATATLSDFDEPSEKLSVSSNPNALVLFNPALVLASIPNSLEIPQAKIKNLENRAGTKLEQISPYHHIKADLPPTIIFHGIADKTVAYETAALFEEEMNKQGNRCELVGYKDEGHGFFNYGRGENGAFIDTVSKMDAFLVSLGYLKRPPEVEK